MRMQVLLLVESLANRGGTELQVLELIARVDANRFRLHVCCFDGEKPAIEIPAPHVFQVFPLEKANSWAAIRQAFRLRRYIRRNGIDIIQTYFFKASVIGAAAAWRAGCRAVVTCRRDLWDTLGARHVRAMRWVNGWTTRILANSEAVKTKVAELERVRPGKIDVLHNGVDMERFVRPAAGCRETRARVGIPEGAAVVGIVANLRPVKDLPLFLKAAREVAGQIPEAVFLIVGKGTLKPQLETLADELGIREKVYFAEGAGNVPEYLQIMRIGCLTSVAEGFSNSILEYMAAGLPVVATAVGGAAEAVAHGVTGYLAQTRNAAELAGYIAGLLRDEEKREAMGRRGYERCREAFEIGGAVRRQEEYWARLIQGGA